jgi:hypothetical protein
MASGGGWEAIDRLTVAEVAFRSAGVYTLDECPVEFRQPWAQALADVLAQVLVSAPRSVEQERGLKWLLYLPQVLLRWTIRGGRRGMGELRRRFAAFAERRCAGLLDEWALAVEAGRHRHAQRVHQAPPDVLARVRKLMAAGEVSLAAKHLESIGLGDLSDPGVVAQLVAKHPARSGLISEEVLAMQVDAEEAP